MLAPERTAASPEGVDTDGLVLTEEDFCRVAKRINDLAGIVLEPHKKQMIQTRLGRRVRALGVASITHYLNLLEGSSGDAEVQNFIDTLTTNLTSFFRERHHFEHLRETIFAGTGDHDREIRIWSAGCSSGEEPYTVSLTATNHLGANARRVKILATDLDSKVLAKAKAGEYAIEKLAQGLGPEYRKYFKPVPGTEVARISEEVGRLILFRQLNLMEAWPMKGPFDAIFCRNVVIYFSAETKARLLERFAALLRPGGYLYLGHSEAILGEHKYFKSLGNTIYQRKAATT